MWWGNSAGIDGMWWGNWPEICWAERCCVPGGSCEGERPEATDPGVPGRGSSTGKFRLVAKCNFDGLAQPASLKHRRSPDASSARGGKELWHPLPLPTLWQYMQPTRVGTEALIPGLYETGSAGHVAAGAAR